MPDFYADPRLLMPKRVSNKSSLEMLDELFMGLSKTSPVLPRPKVNQKESGGLNMDQPRLEQLLRANKSRYGGRRPR